MVALYWQILYWTAFFLSWVILPVLEAYLDNGYFRVQEKLKYAVKYHLAELGIMAVVGVVGLILVLLFSSSSFRHEFPHNFRPDSWSSIVSFVVSASNVWGMIQIIFFLSYGMVALPREFWKSAHLQANLKYGAVV